MATKVVMAQLSPTMEEGKLVEWKVGEGDEVSQGDVVAEIETDKANMDVEAMGSGVLRKKLLEEGETAPVGSLIGVIAGPDEDISALLEEAGAAAAEEAPEEEAADAEAEAPEAEEAEASEAEAAAGEETEAAEEGPKAEGEPEEETEGEEEEPAAAPSGRAEPREAAAGAEPRERRPAAAGDGRVKASPVARRIARDLDLDLSVISGSGPGGRVVKADVEAAATERQAAARAPSRLTEEVEEASQMRKAIARRLVQSIGPVPHFFLTIEVDMGRALEMRADMNARLERRGEKVGVNDVLLKATAEALVRHPEVNASWEEDAIRRHGSVDLGIAVAVEQGLITPVLRSAEGKGLLRIASEARELIERARNRKLKPEEYQGATFSVSNLGMYEIEEFTAIINPPEAGILAVGRTTEKPVAVAGEVVVRPRMRVTMSCDHRVVDGATGAEFLATFKGMLENPLEMLL